MHRTRSIEITLLVLFTLGMSATLFAVYEGEEKTLSATLPGISFTAKQKEPITFFVVGDIMLGRHVGDLMTAYGNAYPFARIGDTLASADFVFGNLEGPVTALDIDATNTMRFGFDPSVAETLKQHNIHVVSVANNHWGDQGMQGHHDTQRFLRDAGVGYAGAQTGSELGTVVTSHNGAISFVGIDTTITPIDSAELARELRAFPEDTFTVALVHWGEEYSPTHNAAQEAFAHMLVDSGVDAVFGAHPHVVQDSETYNGVPIFYSLGNFIFDQYWNADVQTGLMVKVTVGDDIVFESIPIRSEQSQPFVPVD